MSAVDDQSRNGQAGSSPYGRVDDDGTVWVRTAGGERVVGSYPGAPPEDALAYFARKYDEVAAKVALLEQRAATTDVTGKDLHASVARVREEVAGARAVGDLDALLARLDRVDAAARERQAQADAERAEARQRAREAKERIVAEAESLVGSTQWKPVGDRLRALLEEWKAAPRLDRKSDDELWKRFSAARTAFDKARRAHFAALDSERAEARASKERLVSEAEALAGSTDWAATAQRFRELMQAWKGAGRAGRAEEDALWARFRAAQDAFFAARSNVFAERDAGLRANLERKEALVAEAEALLPVTDVARAKKALRSINERWDEVGHVPRADRDRLGARLRRVEEAVRRAEDTRWRRNNPEARSRAEETVAQLRTSVGKLEAEVARERAAGRDAAAAKAAEALEVRRSWLAEAERTLADLTG